MPGLLAGCDATWWLAGGWAIDLLVGQQTRRHEDLDVLVLRPEQHVVREHLREWDVHVADPPGALRPWPLGEELPPHLHDVWIRRDAGSPWRFQLMIDDVDGDDWLFRRDHRIRRPIASLRGRASREDLPVLVPEIQLLYKSGRPRPKDLADLDTVLPHLTDEERRWVHDALVLTRPDHEWIARLAP